MIIRVEFTSGVGDVGSRYEDFGLPRDSTVDMRDGLHPWPDLAIWLELAGEECFLAQFLRLRSFCAVHTKS